ncbi:unnamed protein product, partial [Cyprideis torosa]
PVSSAAAVTTNISLSSGGSLRRANKPEPLHAIKSEPPDENDPDQPLVTPVRSNGLLTSADAPQSAALLSWYLQHPTSPLHALSPSLIPTSPFAPLPEPRCEPPTASLPPPPSSHSLPHKSTFGSDGGYDSSLPPCSVGATDLTTTTRTPAGGRTSRSSTPRDFSIAGIMSPSTDDSSSLSPRPLDCSTPSATSNPFTPSATPNPFKAGGGGSSQKKSKPSPLSIDSDAEQSSSGVSNTSSSVAIRGDCAPAAAAPSTPPSTISTPNTPMLSPSARSGGLGARLPSPIPTPTPFPVGITFWSSMGSLVPLPSPVNPPTRFVFPPPIPRSPTTKAKAV